MLCCVTDRRRPGAGAITDLARRAVETGVDLIQIRERDLEAAALAALVTEVLTIARGSRTRVLVNDRLDVALACGANGVHLRADSVPAASARQLVRRPFLVGQSVHRVEDVRGTQAVDYLIAGPVFPTRSKPEGTTWLGTMGLADIVRAASVPVLAIGGVTVETLPAIAHTGAAGVAAIDLFAKAGRLDAIVEAVRSAFPNVDPWER